MSERPLLGVVSERFLVRRPLALELGRVALDVRASALDVRASALEVGALILATFSPPRSSVIASAGGRFVTFGGSHVPLGSLASGPRLLPGFLSSLLGGGSFLVQQLRQALRIREETRQIAVSLVVDGQSILRRAWGQTA